MSDKKKLINKVAEKKKLLLSPEEIAKELERQQKQLEDEIKELEKLAEITPEIILETKVLDQLSFIESTFTFEDAFKLIHDPIIRFKTSFINILSSCIALTKKGEFIIKERGKEMIEFKLLTRDELIQRLNFGVEYIVSEEEKLMRKRHHKKN